MTRVSSVRITTNYGGIGDLLRSSEMQGDLDDRAERIASAALEHAPLVEGEPGDVALPVITESAGTSSRARALVIIDHPSGIAVEAKHRLLVGSLEAGS